MMDLLVALLLVEPLSVAVSYGPPDDVRWAGRPAAGSGIPGSPDLP